MCFRMSHANCWYSFHETKPMPTEVAAMMHGMAMRKPRMSPHTSSRGTVNALNRSRISMASWICSTWIAV